MTGAKKGEGRGGVENGAKREKGEEEEVVSPQSLLPFSLAFLISYLESSSLTAHAGLAGGARLPTAGQRERRRRVRGFSFRLSFRRFRRRLIGDEKHAYILTWTSFLERMFLAIFIRT